VKIVSESGKLTKAIDETFKLDKKVLVEEYIRGKEITCGVLENFSTEGGPASGRGGQEVAALPVTEIVPVKGHKFFNYDAKYKPGHCQEITPAQIDEATREKVQEIAVRVHQLLGCRGYSRTDMILKNDNIYVLETNTLPGLTTNSLIPQAAKAAGLTFGQLLDKIIESSLS
jgi:D-alanine-D-alanine ligase